MNLTNKKFCFEFIANACGIFSGTDGTKILCDPWIEDGVFEGSWCHFHKLKTKLEDLYNVDAIYISHIHPDHFDERFFNFNKNIPIIILDHGYNFLYKKLLSLGYRNIIKIKDKEKIKFNEFDLTMFAPLSTHNFHESAIGDLINSAILLSCGNLTVLNTNDNSPNQDSARMIAKEFGPITLAMLNYNAAGPYPSCFTNLSDDEKLSESAKLKERNFEHLSKILNIIKPKYFLPFAGAYVLGGKFHYKNKWLANSTWDECANWLEKKHKLLTKTILLRENDIFDISEGKSNNPYTQVNVDNINFYIENNLKNIRYPYEYDKYPDKNLLIKDIELASNYMNVRIKKFNLSIKSNTKFIIKIYSMNLQIYPKFEIINDINNITNRIICQMDSRLLRRILNRESNWNNAEIGAHIDMHRSPNIYEPDLHITLQFFHL